MKIKIEKWIEMEENTNYQNKSREELIAALEELQLHYNFLKEDNQSAISEVKNHDDAFLKLQNLSIELLLLSSVDNHEAFISKKLKELTGAVGVVFSEYDSSKRVLIPKHFEFNPGIIKKVVGLLGKKIQQFNYTVSQEMYREMTSKIIGIFSSLSESTFGSVPVFVGGMVQKLLKSDKFIGLVYLIDGQMYGTSLLIIKKGDPDPPTLLLENFAALVAGVLRRKKAEEALNESEENYKVITQSTMDIIFIIDKFGKQLFLNKSVESVLGYTVEEQIGKQFTEFVPKKLLPDYFSALKSVFLRKEISNFVTQIYHKDGHLVDVEINGRMIRLKGELVAQGTIRDITEKKRAEEALKNSRDRNKALLDANPDLMFVFDSGCRIIDFHSESRDLLLVKPESFLNKLVDEILPQEIAASTHQKIKSVLSTGKPDYLTYELEIGGFLKYFESRFVSCGNNEVMSIVRDITEKKLIEKQLKDKNEELMVANADKDRLMSILGHDLISPFNAILGLLELLTKNIRHYDIAKIEKFIVNIYKSAQNTYHLLEDLLLWTRSQSSKIPYEPLEYHFEDICNDVIENLKLSATNKNITIKHFISKELLVFVDIDMFKTILRNLISNAIKFTNSGGTIDIHAIQNKMNVIISVSDSGIGIEPELMAKLFDVSMTPTTKGTANESGTGLGLLLCKEFVERHHGKIWVESQPGQGSTFKFSIHDPHSIINNY